MTSPDSETTSPFRTVFDIVRGLERDGKSPALIVFGDDGAETVDRQELMRLALALAARLAGAGVSKGDRVAICGRPSREWMVAALAAVRIGAVVVPIDAQMDDEGFAHILRDSSPFCLFGDEDHAEKLKNMELESPPSFLPLEQTGGVSGSRGTTDDPDIGPHDCAVLFYTSGTTGMPKGVPLTHANLTFQIKTAIRANIVSGRDRLMLTLPLHHVYPFVMGFLAPLAVGMPIVLPAALTGPLFLKALREGKVSVMLGVPRLYRALYDGIRARARSRGRWSARTLNAVETACVFLRRRTGIFAGRLLLAGLHRRLAPGLRLMASGGSRLDPELGWRLEGMGWRVVIGYGLTETSPLLTLRLPGQGPLESVGRPIEGVELRLDTGAVPGRQGEGHTAQRGDDRAGEVLARGPGVFRGYRNRERETREAFTSDGWFRTGDLGRFDGNGYLHLTGRVSTLIVTEGGENVQPEDVERGYEGHQAIEEIGVLEKDRKLVALIVPGDKTAGGQGSGPAESVRTAVSECSRRMPSYMRLSGFRLTREALPRTRLGKIRRRLLEKRYEDAESKEPANRRATPLPYEDMSDHDRALLDNRTARRAWEWLCKRFPESGLTPDSSPQSDLEVDSMEWLNLTLEIQECTGVELGPEEIARISTVRDLLHEAVNGAPASGNGRDPLESPYELLSEEQQRWLQPLGRAMHIVSLLTYWLGAALLRTFLKIRVEGLDGVPEDSTCVLAPNHTSYLDPLVLGVILGPRSMSRTYWAGLTDAAFDTAAKRFGCRLGRAVPINPRQGALGGLAFAAAILKRGRRLVWFPEGQRSLDGKLQDFKPGLGKVLERFPVPTVPILIEGTHEAWPVDRRFPRPGRIIIVFGDPVAPDRLAAEGEGGSNAERILDGLRKRLARLSEAGGARKPEIRSQ